VGAPRRTLGLLRVPSRDRDPILRPLVPALAHPPGRAVAAAAAPPVAAGDVPTPRRDRGLDRAPDRGRHRPRGDALLTNGTENTIAVGIVTTEGTAGGVAAAAAAIAGAAAGIEGGAARGAEGGRMEMTNTNPGGRSRRFRPTRAAAGAGAIARTIGTSTAAGEMVVVEVGSAAEATGTTTEGGAAGTGTRNVGPRRGTNDFGFRCWLHVT